MTEPLTASAPAASQDAPAPAGDEAWTRGLIVRQLDLPGRLAEAGLNIALAVERQALAAEAAGAAAPAPGAPASGASAPGAPGSEACAPASAAVGQVVRGDIALAYGRVSRAVRLTVALQARLVEALQALDEGAARRVVRERADAQREQAAAEAARKARVGRIVERRIREEAGDEAEGDRLADEAYERLEDDDIYGDLSDRPIREIVAMICEDLGLAPDWTRVAQEAWAQEAWAREEREAMASAAAGARAPTIRWLDPLLAEAATAAPEAAAGVGAGAAASGAGPPESTRESSLP